MYNLCQMQLRLDTIYVQSRDGPFVLIIKVIICFSGMDSGRNHGSSPVQRENTGEY